MKKTLICLLLSPMSLAQSKATFPLLVSGHVATTWGMLYAYHDGARQCLAEDNRSGEGKLFGTADGFGHRPDSKRVLIPAAAVLGISTFLHFRHHQKAANSILKYYSVGQGTTAVAVEWAGCN